MSYTKAEVESSIERVALPYLRAELNKTVDSDDKWLVGKHPKSYISYRGDTYTTTYIKLGVGNLNIIVKEQNDIVSMVKLEYEILTPSIYSVIPRSTFTRRLNLENVKGVLDAVILKHCVKFIKYFNIKIAPVAMSYSNVTWGVGASFKKLRTSIRSLERKQDIASGDFLIIDSLMDELKELLDKAVQNN